MNDFTITRLPMIVNIDGLSIKLLREQYKLLEKDAISQAHQLGDACSALHRMNKIVHEYSVIFASLCESYEAGDQAAILLQVKQLAERRIKTKAKVH